MGITNLMSGCFYQNARDCEIQIHYSSGLSKDSQLRNTNHVCLLWVEYNMYMYMYKISKYGRVNVRVIETTTQATTKSHSHARLPGTLGKPSALLQAKCESDQGRSAVKIFINLGMYYCCPASRRWTSVPLHCLA